MISFYKGKTPEEKDMIAKSGITIPTGAALKFDANGELELATGSNKPEFISVSKPITTTSSMKGVAVAVIDKSGTQEWIADASVSISNLKLGSKVQLASSADAITATTSSGIVEAIEIINSKKAVVKFD